VLELVNVPLGRPRTSAVLETIPFTRTTATLRSYLSGTDVELAQQEAAGTTTPDVLERAGAPAFFDPFGRAP